MRRVAVLAGWAGLLSLQLLVAQAYLVRGTWWHYLLHQLVGWGAGLALAGLLAATTPVRVPAVVALHVGQLLSIVPDLQFRFGRMPHLPSMDLWLGHIAIHTGPAPLLVAVGVVLLGGWSWLAAHSRREQLASGLAAGAFALLVTACLLATDVPTELDGFPVDTASTLSSGNSR